jgi:hypothetical protein
MNREDDRKPAMDEEIKVTDRRKFSREGERIVPDVCDSRTAADEEEAPSEESAGQDPAAQSAGPQPQADLFVTHVMALSQLGLIHLGQIENPATRKTEVDLPAAREVIDLLGMLQEKTQGNLGAEEQSLLETWLYQLRMAFTERAGKS